MKTRLNIKNFRIFDEDGAIFELNPITILTGCNSSGKSSVVKAIMLMNSFLSQIKRDIDNNNKVKLIQYKLDFTQFPINLLGRFDKVINDKSENRKVTFEYSVYSLVLSKDVDVKLVFTVDENDDLKNGYLECITLTIDGNVFYNSDKEKRESACDLNVIKEYSIDFLILQSLYNIQVGLHESYKFEHKISKEEYEKNHDEVLAYKEKYSNDKICDNNNFNKFLHKDNYTNKYNRYKFLKEIDPEIVEWSQQNGSLFKIPVVVEYLDKLTKREILSILDSEFFNGFDDVEISIYQKIFKDYMESDYELFSDYFKSYEKIFLEYHDYYKIFLLKFINKYPCSIENSYFDFEQPRYFDDGELIFDKHGVESHNKDFLSETLSFEILYGFLMLLNDVYCKDENKFYKKEDSLYQYPKHHHKMYDYLRNVARLLFEEVVTPDWTDCINYASSSTAKISRLYSLDAKDDFTELLKRYFESKRENHHNTKKEYTALDFTNKWIRKFGIGDSLSIEYDEEGLGATIRLHKNCEDVKGRLLSDEGYGITQLVSIILQIETAILSAKGKYVNRIIGPSKDMDDYDYYYRHFQYEMKTICVEEPEIHLHPKYQSLLADMFVEAYQEYNIHFIIETHSEYLIRRLQTLVASKNNDLSSDNISIYYIATNDKYDNGDIVRRINIKKDGRLASAFGAGFFDEADNLAMELLKFKLGE